MDRCSGIYGSYGRSHMANSESIGMKVILDCPYPPGVNTYYRTFQGRMLLSKRGREYKQIVADIVSDNCSTKFEDARLKVQINFHPNSKRKVDLDGRLKSLIDAVQDAGLMNDDEQIDDLRIIRCEAVPGGRATIIIEDIE